jgi:hypothetical protein
VLFSRQAIVAIFFMLYNGKVDVDLFGGMDVFMRLTRFLRAAVVKKRSNYDCTDSLPFN